MGNDSTNSPRQVIFGICGVLAMAFFGWGIWVRLPPPQLKLDDEQVFNTVDALFTAVTTRDLSRLDQCEQRLMTYHEEGRMSDAVAVSLETVIQQARDGQWEPAAKRLYGFMLGQRR